METNYKTDLDRLCQVCNGRISCEWVKRESHCSYYFHLQDVIEKHTELEEENKWLKEKHDLVPMEESKLSYAELEKEFELEKNKAETNYRALKLACINVAMREAISSTGSLEGLDKMTESVMKDYIETAREEIAKENNNDNV